MILAASACLSFRAFSTFSIPSMRSARTRRCSASEREKPRSRNTFPLERLSLLLPLGMAASLPSFHKVAVSLPCYLQVPLSCLAAALLKSVQDVHSFGEPGYVEHPVGCPGLNSNLSDARTDSGHGFPITRLKPSLEAEQLEPFLSFVIINRRGNCGLVCPGNEKESRVDARETVPLSRRLRA